MQIKPPMPTSTALFKSKWNYFMTKLSIHHSTIKEEDNKEEYQPRRKYSDDISVGTFDSSISMKDKFKQAIPFFRRRSSNNQNHSEESFNNAPISFNYSKEIEKLYSLYNLAVDELNYAEDSQGSSYYSGDLEAAREALNNCNICFLTLFQNLILHHNTREELELCIAPKLLKLQKRVNDLPEATDNNNNNHH
ncbi:uncharacterized protein BX663DRAFT_557458 [Cokeromyces recurvatus]|uniref:uncharacterized protein n=1 Tax=Cokeromyces recurvatus TaxID=90255 RepID=UPI002220497A|nr:uncharacterized protein BX663DRAFT_557458 [Cokeromyces recurvatus]KAI7908319.1 hypothetical protein BX663DRAFT_557458 [Cokeromyces recurvatus]